MSSLERAVSEDAGDARGLLENFQVELVAVVPPADHLVIVVLLFVTGHEQDVGTNLVQTTADGLQESCGCNIGRW